MRAMLRVREVAEGKGYNMSRLSRKSDVSFTTVKKYFQQPYEVASTDTLAKIAEVLGVEIGDLVELVDDESDENSKEHH